MRGSTGSERCFWISAGPEMSRFSGSEGQWGIPHRFGLWMEEFTDGCGGSDSAWLSVSGERLRNVVSTEAAEARVPLEMDSSDFLVNLTSVWEELWSKEITFFNGRTETTRTTSGSLSTFLYLCGNPAVYLYGRNGVHAVQHWCPSSILARWFCRQGTRWYGAISGGHWRNLPLEELKNNIDISSHPGLQSGKGRDSGGRYHCRDLFSHR